LAADELATIADMIHEALPYVETIGCYARIPNVAAKTNEELAMLAAKGYADINIGVESGLDDVLALMNKGYDVATAREQFARLHAAGLTFNINVINAAAGPSRIAEHAAANAALVNEARPTLIFVSPLHVDPGTPLVRLVEQGAFEECTLGQYLEEEIAFLEGLTLDDCVFFGLHVSNPVPVQGLLGRDKAAMLARLRRGMAEIPREVLDSHPAKGAEGRLR
jgi:radical SAM superfamily enzyme